MNRCRFCYVLLISVAIIMNASLVYGQTTTRKQRLNQLELKVKSLNQRVSNLQNQLEQTQTTVNQLNERTQIMKDLQPYLQALEPYLKQMITVQSDTGPASSP